MNGLIIVSRSSIHEMSIEELQQISCRLINTVDRKQFTLEQRYVVKNMLDLIDDEIARKKRNTELDKKSIYWFNQQSRKEGQNGGVSSKKQGY